MRVSVSSGRCQLDVNVKSGLCPHLVLVALTAISATLGLGEADRQIYDVAADFANTRMAPFAAKWDQEEILPGASIFLDS